MNKIGAERIFMEQVKYALIFLCNKIVEILYPQTCIICGKEHKNSICEKCENQIHRIYKYKYINVKNRYFENNFYIFKYKRIIKKIIIDYKFNEKSYYYKFLSKIILKNIKIYG